MARLPDHQAFRELDVVETDFSGKQTLHIVVRRLKVRNSQTGICYEVIPAVPRSGESGRIARIDHDWFKRVGRVALEDGLWRVRGVDE